MYVVLCLWTYLFVANEGVCGRGQAIEMAGNVILGVDDACNQRDLSIFYYMSDFITSTTCRRVSHSLDRAADRGSHGPTDDTYEKEDKKNVAFL